MFALVKVLRARVGSDRGASALEYIGAVIVAGLVVTAMVAGIGQVDIEGAVKRQAEKITNK